MRRSIAFIAALGAGAAVLVPLASADQTQSQRFFRDKLLGDSATSQEVKDLLRSGGFVDRSVVFRDLTGDKKVDAIVRVQSGGAAGAVAVYVFSTDTGRNDKELRAVFRSKRLLRASTTVKDGLLTYRTARYAPGDELCCPDKMLETTLRWDRKERRLRVGERKEVDLPPPGAAPTPTPTPTATPRAARAG
jgi:hypothetical protein